MNKSESIVEIAKALASFTAEAENASKNSQNPHFRSSYADLAEVINTVRPVLAKHGLSFLQAPRYENGIVTVETMILHSSGEFISSEVSAPVSKNDAQGVGSAITYCRRYGLSAMCGIAQEDDDGNAASQPPARKAQPAPDGIQIEAWKERLMSITDRDHLRNEFRKAPPAVRQAIGSEITAYAETLPAAEVSQEVENASN